MQSEQEPSRIRADIDAAQKQVVDARALRARHRWKSFKGGHLRRTVFDAQIKACAQAAKPVRKYIGMLPTHPELAPFDWELRDVSRALTAERRRLRKMLPDAHHRSRGDY